MHIYVAGTFTDRDRIKYFLPRIKEAGHHVTSTWFEESVSAYNGVPFEEWEASLAKKDLTELLGSELLILDTFSHSSTGGKDVELGWALCAGIPVWIVGPIYSIFHRLATKHFTWWPQCLEELALGDIIEEERASV